MSDVGRVKNQTFYRTAVYWPSEGEYGGITEHATKEEAQLAAAQTMALGFKMVDIWKVKVQVVEYGEAIK